MLSQHVLYPASAAGEIRRAREGAGSSRLVHLLKQSFAYQIERRGGGHWGERGDGNGDTTVDECLDKKQGEENKTVGMFHEGLPQTSTNTSPQVFLSGGTHTTDSNLSLLTNTSKSLVRRLTEDYVDEHFPRRPIGFLKPYIPAGKTDEDVQAAHSLSCMAFVNGEGTSCLEGGSLLCGTDRGTLLEYCYSPSAVSPASMWPVRVLSIPGVSSLEGLLVEPYADSLGQVRRSVRDMSGVAVSNKRQTNVKIRDISTDRQARHLCVGSSDGTLTLIKRTFPEHEGVNGGVGGGDSGSGGVTADVNRGRCSYEQLVRSKVHEVIC